MRTLSTRREHRTIESLGLEPFEVFQIPVVIPHSKSAILLLAGNLVSKEEHMSWKNQLRNDSVPWLLEPENPGVRYLALRDLLDLPLTTGN